MKATGNKQINDAHYWDGVYKDRQKYLDEQTGPTARFTTTLKYLKGAKHFLDIGCGVGEMTELAKRTYPELDVWGTDIAEKTIEKNRKRREEIVYLPRAIGEHDDLPAGHFDVIFAGEVLEHLDDPHELFKEAKRLLKRGGRLIITTPNGAAIQTPEHTWFFDHEDIELFYEGAGFQFEQFEYLPDKEHLMVIYAVGRKL